MINLALALALLALSQQAPDERKLYPLGPDSQRQEGVPKGTVTKWTWQSKVFEGTTRDCWTYVPAQYDASKPTAVMVFQDGGGYQNETGGYRVPVVFDNLIHKKEIPPIVGIFINPGTFPPKNPNEKPRSNRSFEYDSLGDPYARFLIDEILPEVGKSLNLTKDPAQRAIGGASSGGICAWTVAWERPDAFRKVLSHVGSFANIRGGHDCQARIRKTDPKPIRVFLQDGTNDLDNEHGSWPIGNKEMAASLAFKKYDYKIVWGEGKHSGVHGGAILPDSLRWLWRPEDAPKEEPKPSPKPPDEKTLFKFGPDSERKEGVPQGKVSPFVWKSKVFEGTIRECWTYVPAQYDGSTPAAVMIFQDGHTYVDEKGQFRVPVVFDNLIHKKEMPVTVGIFINPGHKSDRLPKPGWGGKDNRSVEYDSLSDQYARFLLEEILPEVGKSVKLSTAAKDRAICGISSGGICAFVAAWERQNEFGKVLSHVGSFTNIRGGHALPYLIRKTPTRPTRVFLQDGTNDLDNVHGSWPLANQDMGAALKFKGWDHKVEWGEGGHSGVHGGAILPDSLRWLWRPDLLKDVTFYASFDEAVRGDFGGGELELSTRSNHKTEKGAFVFEKGYPSSAFRVAPGKGISGGALEAVDVLPDNGRIFFPAKGNIAYRKGGWGATLSMWINHDPDTQLKTRFCDPVQITHRGAGNGGLWFDFNDAKPNRNLRMGAFPAVPEGKQPIKESREDFSPMVWIDKPGLKVGEWRHVALVWRNLDTGRNDGRASLYIDGKLVGEVKDKDYPLSMDWDMDKVGIYVAVSYIGLIDEFALFNRPLTGEEVGLLKTRPNLLSPLKR